MRDGVGCGPRSGAARTAASPVTVRRPGGSVAVVEPYKRCPALAGPGGEPARAGRRRVLRLLCPPGREPYRPRGGFRDYCGPQCVAAGDGGG